MSNPVEGRAEFALAVNVSRETMDRLDTYAALLKKWNRAINLVSPLTLPKTWTRHFLDSAQVLQYSNKAARIWVDIGAGAGFPGLVIACMAPELRPDLEVICIESDERKAVFLQTVIRELKLNACVMTKRSEDAAPCRADIVSARAVAPVGKLLTHAKRHLNEGGKAIFLKGGGHLQEIADAREQWAFDISTFPSKTEPSGAILVFGDIKGG